MSYRASHHRGGSSSDSECSDYSYHSRSTAPTDYSARPSLEPQEGDKSYCKPDARWSYDSFDISSSPRRSTETYASTVPSEADLDTECPVFEEPVDYYQPELSSAYPSTPSDFAAFFPSTRRLHLRHDDTVDGNMNLRVDTDFRSSSGVFADLTLFHLRMHDLKNRDFSLRRYCRDSGREVCHSSRKYTEPSSSDRPGFQRSMSNAIATLKSLSDNKRATNTSLKRTDSGYDSMSDDEELDLDQSTPTAPGPVSRSLPTNTTNLEFSSYAHVDLKRRGTKSSKRYEFDYWGQRYIWRRLVKKQGTARQISYHLYSSERIAPIAHIVPNALSADECMNEEEKGGWIPPSSMWLRDTSITEGRDDVAE